MSDSSTGEGIGSPPQVRGKPKKHDATQVANGITPAGAGKTFWLFNKRFSNKDHPRRCGENLLAFQ